MAIDQHIVSRITGDVAAYTDRTPLACQYGIANPGGAAGATVSVAVTGFVNLPANYIVVVNPKQAVNWYVDTQTSTGFTVHFTPLNATDSVAATAFDVMLVA
jgi:hypothetical protein